MRVFELFFISPNFIFKNVPNSLEMNLFFQKSYHNFAKSLGNKYSSLEFGNDSYRLKPRKVHRQTIQNLGLINWSQDHVLFEVSVEMSHHRILLKTNYFKDILRNYFY